MRRPCATVIFLLTLFAVATPARALDRPWIGDVFFYWYTWDYDRRLGSWVGGIHNTPLEGYYDSRTLGDNRRSLRTASEWGMTHHFMDYWTPDWKGEGGRMREAIVMEAAESLRKDGYDISMGYYQDGQNFAMREFSRNVSEKRDVYQWLRDFAGSEVWPKIDGKPLQLVYSRNGRPETTVDHEGFREFLRQRYRDVATLNETWGTASLAAGGTAFDALDRIEMSFSARGHQRAESIEYQYQIWQREWEKLDGLIRQEFDLPGMRASFDVGYGPFGGFGYANFARVFGGPHSYGGIFGPPHDQDAQRFIQAAVAKRYGTVFFDHFKNYYFDWDIRTPGMAYLPDPHHFDRFWVGALARRSEALLHLSWNEWWEGSNLEPCREFGKTYCEKNLFYATLMKLAFESIRQTDRVAPVALLLNDWRFATGSPDAEEIYETIAILRRLGVPFDLLPDEMVDAEHLKNVRLVVAPAYRCGLGYNARRERITDVLAAWLHGADRRLIVSADASIARMCGLREVEPPPGDAVVAGDDLNVYVDVGTQGDEKFLRSGFSQRETGMHAGDDGSFRWTPAVGDETSLLLPASPGRDHVLRLAGNTMWPNAITVLVNGRKAASVEIPAGAVRTEVAVPAAAIGSAPMIRLQLRHAEMHVPAKKVPDRHPGEQRICNLSLNHLQWSTANVPAGTTKPRYTIREDAVELLGDLFGPARAAELSVAFRPRPHLDASGATVLSRCRLGSAVRDLAVPLGRSQVHYVNGPLSEIDTDAYWMPLLQEFGGVEFHRHAMGPHCMPGRLWAGDTQFVVCFNEDIEDPRDLRLCMPASDVPLAEARVLSRDGCTYQPLKVTSDATSHRSSDTLQYYGVYQFAFSPVKVETPELVLRPGEKGTFTVRATNLTDRAVQGSLEISSVIPTLIGQPVRVELGPGQTKGVPLAIHAAPTSDWGRKTVFVRLNFAGHRAVVLRELVVQKPPEVQLDAVVLDPADASLQLRVLENPYGETATLRGASVTFRGRRIELPEIAEGGRAEVDLPLADLPVVTQPTLHAEKLSIDPGGPVRGEPVEHEVFLALRPKSVKAPADAVATWAVFNARSKPLDRQAVSAAVAKVPNPFCVKTDEGVPVPAQVDPDGTLRWLAAMPARSGRLFHLCRTEASAKSDLQVVAERLGTGQGTLRIENTHLSVTLSEAAGGTMTGFRSKKTDRDYGLSSFGINYGTFSRHDPARPQTDTVKYIHESKTRQEDTAGRIELICRGPAVAVARVTWADEKVSVEQTYRFAAYQPTFTIRQQVRPIDLEGEQELVAINAQFKPHRLTKTYPNFVGVPADREQPHFGWRQGTWVPPYATLMTPNHFDESVSLVIADARGLIGIRQGFWPRQRPASGKCEVAQIEMLAERSSPCDAEIHVLLHPGHQIAAEQFHAELRLRPRVELLLSNQGGGPM
ncbi:MAG: hypothetical protein HQ567_17000 [Candidatus Nealsonbacteria bacterium]|nr:hypothetical protein [Candidatus Nealsonbacteria bacterium]